VVVAGGNIYLVFEDNAHKIQIAKYNGSSWSAPTELVSSGGMPRIMYDGTDFYVVYLSGSSVNLIYCAGADDPLDAGKWYGDFAVPGTTLTADGNYDPDICQVGGEYRVYFAPYDSGTDSQWIEVTTSTTPQTSTSWSPARLVLAGQTGIWTYWPTPYVEGSDLDLFYASEASPGNVFLAEEDYTTIQAAVDAASDGDTINVGSGTYSGTIDIDSRGNLQVVGADKNTVIFKPASTLDWNVGGYGSSRQAAVRVVNSTGITLQKMTMDFDLVKGNLVHGILYWDSTGTVDDNILQNMSDDDASGYYYEITSYFRAPSYTDTSRADITVSNNTFINAGRLGVCTHQYVDADITLNTFYKTVDDFGYAVELGSESIGEITHNTIYGYDTAALSDGSNSAGIYIENAFTGTTSGVIKNVLVEDNEIYDCQWGLYIGNEFDGYAGDVDIVATVKDNNIHDNLDGGALFTDEDMEHSSSVNVTCQGNTLTNNGDYGYYIYTQGDGDITVSLPGDVVTGHDTGIYLEDTAGGSSSSSYDITANYNDISGNTTYGINNTISSITVDATNNWWGHFSGPSGQGSGTGDAVSIDVDFDPWLDSWPAVIITSVYTTNQIDQATTYFYQGDIIRYHIDYTVAGDPSATYDVKAKIRPALGARCPAVKKLLRKQDTAVSPGTHHMYKQRRIPACAKRDSWRNVRYRLNLKTGATLHDYDGATSQILIYRD
jgi:hypothetical protein